MGAVEGHGGAALQCRYAALVEKDCRVMSDDDDCDLCLLPYGLITNKYLLVSTVPYRTVP